jgi:hypothetical protein
MTPQVGHTVQWRRANGRGVQMVVDLVYEVDGERWLFGRLGPNATFLAVNQRFVLSVR